MEDVLGKGRERSNLVDNPSSQPAHQALSLKSLEGALDRKWFHRCLHLWGQLRTGGSFGRFRVRDVTPARGAAGLI